MDASLKDLTNHELLAKLAALRLDTDVSKNSYR